MENLIDELNKFWEWARMNPSSYAVNRGKGEWEEDYPGWSKLESAFIKEIEEFNFTNSDESIDLIFQTIAIDNESGNCMDIGFSLIENKDYFLEKSVNYFARIKMANCVPFKRVFPSQKRILFKKIIKGFK